MRGDAFPILHAVGSVPNLSSPKIAGAVAEFCGIGDVKIENDDDDDGGDSDIGYECNRKTVLSVALFL